LGKRKGSLRSSLLIPAGLAFATVGCGESAEQREREASAYRPERVVTPRRTREAYYESFISAIPSYGGHFFDSQGNAHAYVANLTDTVQAKRIFGAMARERPRGYSSRTDPGVPVAVIHQGSYTYRELASWQNLAIHHVSGIDGVRGLGIDMRNNAIRIAVAHEHARRKVVDSLTQLGVPPAALRVEHGGAAFSF